MSFSLFLSVEAPPSFYLRRDAFARLLLFKEDLDNEEALRWAALERLSTYLRACRGISKDLTGEKKEVDGEDEVDMWKNKWRTWADPMKRIDRGKGGDE
ncbi:hypothetical protein K1719_001462 [Acacia pycnantha]|nr:hypothetical protein K1719_001462 [Acacia pycnantha]